MTPFIIGFITGGFVGVVAVSILVISGADKD